MGIPGAGDLTLAVLGDRGVFGWADIIGRRFGDDLVVGEEVRKGLGIFCVSELL